MMTKVGVGNTVLLRGGQRGLKKRKKDGSGFFTASLPRQGVLQDRVEHTLSYELSVLRIRRD